MKLHREGTNIIIFTLLATVALNVLSFAAMGGFHFATWIVFSLSILYLLLTIYFFRVPERTIAQWNSNAVLCPADGTVVVIEKVLEQKYFNEERMQVSIFMSPLNVHINWYPIAGKILKTEYCPGKFLVAWHPKSSTLNEAHSVVMDWQGQQILVKQIAGAAARRIVNYAEVDESVQQGEEMGFIKFGSRVDVLLPVDATVAVQLGQKVSGLTTLLAEMRMA